MAQTRVNDLWCTKLCPPGSDCEGQTCAFAHHLRELRPPNEMDQLYDCAWADGVDRWFGQTMQPEQMERFLFYYNSTPAYEVPVWAHGLRYVCHVPHVLSDRYQM